MGRIKPTYIKRVGEEIWLKYTGRLKGDFEHNKKFLDELIAANILAVPSKRMRNKVAGYLVRAVRPTHNPMYKAAPVRPQRRFVRRFIRR